MTQHITSPETVNGPNVAARRFAHAAVGAMFIATMAVLSLPAAHAACTPGQDASLTNVSSDAAAAFEQTGTGPDAAAAFISVVSNQGLAVLMSADISNDARRAALRQTYDAAFAGDEIARLVLGRHWRDLSAEQRTKFADALGDSLADMLVRYLPGGHFDVKSVEPAADDGARVDMVVRSVFVAETMSSVVDWSLAAVDCHLKIVDVTIAGRSLLLSQRGRFEEELRQNGGSVDALIAEMANMSPFEEQADASAL
jgi:phospholipid transport system substrate-binding protein